MLKSRISMLTDRIDSLVRLPYSVLLTMYALGILLCGIGYLLLYLYVPEQGPTIPAGPIWESAANALYFSLVTALSIGYGDIVPQGISKVLSMAEALGALFVFGILISKPISYRQEVALSQVHSLTFNDVFTNTREELFVIRRDLETLGEHARTNGVMSKKDWRNLVTAYRHYCILLETIQDFYPGKGGLYVITEKRELLLLDAAQRTIDRMIQTHAAFQTAKIQHSDDLESAEELQAVLQLNKTLLPRWKEQSLNRYPTNFARLLETADAFETLAARS